MVAGAVTVEVVENWTTTTLDTAFTALTGTNSGSRFANIDGTLGPLIRAARALGGATDNELMALVNRVSGTVVNVNIEET